MTFYDLTGSDHQIRLTHDLPHINWNPRVVKTIVSSPVAVIIIIYSAGSGENLVSGQLSGSVTHSLSLTHPLTQSRTHSLVQPTNKPKRPDLSPDYNRLLGSDVAEWNFFRVIKYGHATFLLSHEKPIPPYRPPVFGCLQTIFMKVIAWNIKRQAVNWSLLN